MICRRALGSINSKMTSHIHFAEHSSSSSMWITHFLSRSLGITQKMHASAFEMQLLHLRLQLQQMKKGDFTMSKYLKKVSVAKDLLASAGEKLKESQAILITLGGLDPVYTKIKCQICSCTGHSKMECYYYLNLSCFTLMHKWRLIATGYLGSAAANVVSHITHIGSNIKDFYLLILVLPMC